MRFSEAQGRTIVATGSADTVGRVTGFIVDPGASRVVALRVKKAHGEGDTLPWSDVTAMGADVVTVQSAMSVQAAEGQLLEQGNKRHEIVGKRVLTERGDELGQVRDVDFDPADGSVRALLTTGEEVAGARLMGVGSYAVVVQAARG